MVNEERIKKVVEKFKDLPPLPDILFRVEEIANDPDSSARDLSDIIALDQALTLRVLNVVNSPYYGLGRKISSISQATAYLGFKEVRNLVMVDVFKGIYSRPIKGYGLDGTKAWEHNAAVGITARLLAKKFGKDVSEAAFTAGITHDVGKLILSDFMLLSYDDVTALLNEGPMCLVDAERGVIGIDHAKVGALVARHWRLPDELSHVIEFHHEPSRVEDPSPVLLAVYLANEFCTMMGIDSGIGNPTAGSEVDGDILEYFGIRKQGMEEYTYLIREELAKAQNLIG